MKHLNSELVSVLFETVNSLNLPAATCLDINPYNHIDDRIHQTFVRPIPNIKDNELNECKKILNFITDIILIIDISGVIQHSCNHQTDSDLFNNILPTINNIINRCIEKTVVPWFSCAFSDQYNELLIKLAKHTEDNYSIPSGICLTYQSSTLKTFIISAKNNNLPILLYFSHLSDYKSIKEYDLLDYANFININCPFTGVYWYFDPIALEMYPSLRDHLDTCNSNIIVNINQKVKIPRYINKNMNVSMIIEIGNTIEYYKEIIKSIKIND